MTFNPVWGCRNKCEYCYAREIAGYRYNWMADKEYNFMRWNYRLGSFCKGEFANRLRHFVPTFVESNFNKKLPRKSQRIFVGSMSEIYYWKEEWVLKVLDKIKLYPQHIFQFLTKSPEVYRRYIFPKNCWLGVTITDNLSACHCDSTVALDNFELVKFVNIEPMLGRIEPESLRHLVMDWVAIGAETGNRRGKIVPKKGWIDDLVYYCDKNGIPVYLGNSLKEIYPISVLDGRKEFPNNTWPVYMSTPEGALWMRPCLRARELPKNLK